MDDNTGWVVLILGVVASITVYQVVDRVCSHLADRNRPAGK